MAENGYDQLQNYAQGLGVDASKIPKGNSSPTFTRMIVLDVISDPNNDLADDKRKVYWKSWGISNESVSSAPPRNSIIAKKVGSAESAMIVFPFFPSHLSMPCKAGECVWVMFEKPDASSVEIAYWFCKVVELHTVDDVNHTHSGRALETTLFPGTQDKFESESSGAPPGDEVWHELRNAAVIHNGDERDTTTKNAILKGMPDDIFETLVTKTDASKLTVYDAVPRYRKRPGDLVLEGSNNALIAIGTDRVGPLATYVPPEENLDKELKTTIPKLPDDDLKNQAGSIDIVTGRGRTEDTFGKEDKTTSFIDAKGKTKGSEIKKELNKALSIIKKTEGDPDLVNDSSRILISQRTKVDKNFKIDSYNKGKLKVEDGPNGDAGIVIKSDKIRLIARSDVQILVTNFSAGKAPDNQDIKKEETDQDKWASVTIKSNGDIVFTPSKKGYIKLGGDDANLGIVCSDIPVSATDGNVVGAPIQTPMGGPFAGSKLEGDSNGPVTPSMGKFANKVLIK